MYTASAVLSLPPESIRMWRSFDIKRILPRSYDISRSAAAVSGCRRVAPGEELPHELGEHGDTDVLLVQEAFVPKDPQQALPGAVRFLLQRGGHLHHPLEFAVVGDGDADAQE